MPRPRSSRRLSQAPGARRGSADNPPRTSVKIYSAGQVSTPFPVVSTMAKKSLAPRRRSAGERLLAAADELFYGAGINSVGIDRVIEHAGVAKASLYDCFGSKEGLIRAYLAARHEGRQKLLRDRLARYGKPRDRLLAVFDLMAEIAPATNFRR